MNAKIKRQFLLTIGTNDKEVTKRDLIKKALQLEQLGNSNLGARFHIFEPDIIDMFIEYLECPFDERRIMTLKTRDKLLCEKFAKQSGKEFEEKVGKMKLILMEEQ